MMWGIKAISCEMNIHHRTPSAKPKGLFTLGDLVAYTSPSGGGSTDSFCLRLRFPALLGNTIASCITLSSRARVVTRCHQLRLSPRCHGRRGIAHGLLKPRIARSIASKRGIAWTIGQIISCITALSRRSTRSSRCSCSLVVICYSSVGQGTPSIRRLRGRGQRYHVRKTSPVNRCRPTSLTNVWTSSGSSL